MVVFTKSVKKLHFEASKCVFVPYDQSVLQTLEADGDDDKNR
jgi:hypothetical protein